MNTITNIWVKTWELRQTIRTAMNGYAVSELVRLIVMAFHEIRYYKKL